MTSLADWLARSGIPSTQQSLELTRAVNIEWVLNEIDISIDKAIGIAISNYCPYKKGDILLSTSNENPAARFPNTTWVAWGQGRVPVGMGGSYTSVEATGGQDSVTLSLAQIPSHTHGYVEPIGAVGAIVGTAGHIANADKRTGSEGGGQAHENRQPYITCYMWKRTG
jgi:hypothetical protein